MGDAEPGGSRVRELLREKGLVIPPIVYEMIDRRREKQSFDALDDLVEYLGPLRPERKTVITISDGWRLFGEGLTELQGAEPPRVTPPTTEPGSGRITTRDVDSDRVVTAKCEEDRAVLGRLRHEERFDQILDRANRANITFYPIDPRGVAIFDEDISKPLGLIED